MVDGDVLDIPREHQANNVRVEAEDEVVASLRILLNRGIRSRHVDSDAVLPARLNVHTDGLVSEVCAVVEDLLPELHLDRGINVEVGVDLRVGEDRDGLPRNIIHAESEVPEDEGEEEGEGNKYYV